MEKQTHSSKLLFLEFSANLIFEVEENIRDLIQRTLQILDDLELALNILEFSQHQYTAPKGCNHPHLHYHTSIFIPSANRSPDYPELRRCQKYTELRDASQRIIEAQRMEMKYVKPRVVYNRRPAFRNDPVKQNLEL
jgi:hypothetical protein